MAGSDAPDAGLIHREFQQFLRNLHRTACCIRLVAIVDPCPGVVAQ